MTQQGEVLTTPADLAPRTIAETIARHAARQPERLAIVGSDFGEEVKEEIVYKVLD